MTIVFGLVEEKKDSGLSGGLNLESLLIHPLLLQMQALFLMETTMCSEWHWHEEFLFSYLFSLLLTTQLRGSFERAIS